MQYHPIELPNLEWKLYLDSDGHVNELPDRGVDCLIRITDDSGCTHHEVMVLDFDSDTFRDSHGDEVDWSNEEYATVEFMQLETCESIEVK